MGKNKTKKTICFCMRMSNELHEMLIVESKKKNMTKTAVIETALKEYFEKKQEEENKWISPFDEETEEEENKFIKNICLAKPENPIPKDMEFNEVLKEFHKRHVKTHDCEDIEERINNAQR